MKASMPALARIAFCFAAFCAAGVAAAQDAFPYDRELLLDARPMRPGKRMPGLTVATDGRAVFDFWCRSAAGRVAVAGDTIVVEIAELPADPPLQQSAGQCTPERLAADEALRASLLGATTWRWKGQAVELSGTATFIFRPMTN